MNKRVGRLAMRVEGDLWVAYYADPDTMDGAVFLGSIQMVFAMNPKSKEAFMEVMRDAVSVLIQDMYGATADWPGKPRAAPDYERRVNKTPTVDIDDMALAVHRGLRKEMATYGLSYQTGTYNGALDATMNFRKADNMVVTLTVKVGNPTNDG